MPSLPPPPQAAPAAAPALAPASASASTSQPVHDAPLATSSSGAPSVPVSREVQRQRKFEALLAADVVDLKALQVLSWSGIPHQFRTMAWQLLIGYMPPNRAWRAQTLERKRREYSDAVPQYFDISDSERTEYQRSILHQILIDVPRTAPAAKIFHHDRVQRALERILYIWALRHPASGYVQGINDLVTPFFFVFLCGHLPSDRPSVGEDVDSLPQEVLMQVEADAYWCLSRLIDTIQDHYTFAQPGIQRMVFKLKELVARIFPALHAHLADQNLQFIQFAFRWMNCLLMRELSLDLILRVWDTYLAEHSGPDDASFGETTADGFAVLHVYVCVALLEYFSAELQKMEFQDLVMFLQHLPTTGWSQKEVSELLSKAYIYKTRFHRSPSHLSALMI